jgi:Protein of unknown function (DUF3617).
MNPLKHTRLPFFVIASALTFATIGAQAQTTPPIKAGLWEIHHEVDGRKAPDMSERLKHMSPEEREKVEAMMKQRGFDPSNNGMKVCYTREMLDKGDWSNQQTCKVDYSSRSAAYWKWHATCPQYGYEGDGEATFPDSKNFVVKSSGVTTTEGTAKAQKVTSTGKWLAADCGQIKPLEQSTP